MLKKFLGILVNPKGSRKPKSWKKYEKKWGRKGKKMGKEKEKKEKGESDFFLLIYGNLLLIIVYLRNISWSIKGKMAAGEKI